MGKWFVGLWLLVVLGVLGGMWAWMFDRRDGLPKGTQIAAVNPLDNLKKEAEKAVDAAKKDATKAVDGAAKAVTDAAKDLSKEGSNWVQPEDLAQGFIILVTDKTQHANASSPIFMPSSHNGWNPQDPKMQLSAQSDMKWRIIWEKPKLDSRIAFKFARGSWETVEVTADFKDQDNRMLPKVDMSKVKPGEKPIIELEIVAWRDQRPWEPGLVAVDRYRTIDIGGIGTLRRMEVVGGGVTSLSRDVLVWLPPGYDNPGNADRRYPVLYLMDGQNVFEKLPSVPASWDAHIATSNLMDSGKVEPFIIVGVPHAGGMRAQEYLPFPMIENVRPNAGEFISFLGNELKPRIDRAFRTETTANRTAIGGASLGAIVALEAATERPDLFGMVIAESMPLVSKDRAAFKHFSGKGKFPAKLFIGMGGKEAGTNAADDGLNAQYVGGATALADLARGKGVPNEGVKLVIDNSATHNEMAWAKRFPAAIEFLFPNAK